MATLPLCALASGVRRASKEVDSPQRHKGHRARRQRTEEHARLIIAFCLPLCSLCLCDELFALSRVFGPQLIEEFLTVGRYVPGVGPEAQVHAPPLLSH